MKRMKRQHLDPQAWFTWSPGEIYLALSARRIDGPEYPVSNVQGMFTIGYPTTLYGRVQEVVWILLKDGEWVLLRSDLRMPQHSRGV